MILKDRPAKSMSRTQKALLAIAAAAVLLVFPTWSDRGPHASPSDPTPAASAEDRAQAQAEQDYLAQVEDLERRGHGLRFRVSDCRFSIFPDGRALLFGIDDPLRARALYDRWIGA